MAIEAVVVCDSVNPQGNRLTTFRLRYPKFIHGEFLTHRVFSRNASSSRAVPTARLIEEVRSDAHAAPVFWGKNQPGMQAAEELDDEFECVGYSGVVLRDQPATPAMKFGSTGPSPGKTQKALAEITWRQAALSAANNAEYLLNLGTHKQIANRLLEPFSHINVVVTATEYANFFGLRLDKAAQPEMRALADAMFSALMSTLPKLLAPGEWHLPFVADDDDMGFDEGVALIGSHPPLNNFYYSRAVKVSVARCARVSYLSFDTGKRSTVEEDLRLYDRLIEARPAHLSPAEHQATPDKFGRDRGGNFTLNGWLYPEQWGNLVGWRQYRKMIAGEAVAPLPAEYAP